MPIFLALGHLLDDSLWHDMCDLFVKDACALLGLGVESPLSVSVNAGCKTLPGLLNIKQVKKKENNATCLHVYGSIPLL